MPDETRTSPLRALLRQMFLGSLILPPLLIMVVWLWGLAAGPPLDAKGLPLRPILREFLMTALFGLWAFAAPLTGGMLWMVRRRRRRSQEPSA